MCCAELSAACKGTQGSTCDHSVKVLEPVHVLLGAGAAGEQEVHDDVGVVPEAVGGQEQLAPARAQRLQQLGQPRVLRSISKPDPSTSRVPGFVCRSSGQRKPMHMHILTASVEQGKRSGVTLCRRALQVRAQEGAAGEASPLRTSWMYFPGFSATSRFRLPSRWHRSTAALTSLQWCV